MGKKKQAKYQCMASIIVNVNPGAPNITMAQFYANHDHVRCRRASTYDLSEDGRRLRLCRQHFKQYSVSRVRLSTDAPSARFQDDLL